MWVGAQSANIEGTAKVISITSQGEVVASLSPADPPPPTFFPAGIGYQFRWRVSLRLQFLYTYKKRFHCSSGIMTKLTTLRLTPTPEEIKTIACPMHLFRVCLGSVFACLLIFIFEFIARSTNLNMNSRCCGSRSCFFCLWASLGSCSSGKSNDSVAGRWKI